MTTTIATNANPDTDATEYVLVSECSGELARGDLDTVVHAALTNDGYSYAIYRGPDGWWQLHRSLGSANSMGGLRGFASWVNAISDATTLEQARAEIFRGLATYDYRGLSIMRADDYDALEAE